MSSRWILPLPVMVTAAACTIVGCSDGPEPTEEPRLTTTSSSLRTNCLTQFDGASSRKTHDALVALMDKQTVTASECAEYGAMLESIRAVDALLENDMPDNHYGFGFVVGEQQ